MLQIIGPEQTPEYQAATNLAARITGAWTDLEQNLQHHMTIVSSAKCYGQQVCDIDLIIFFHTTNPYTLPTETNKNSPIHIMSFCIAIEVKDHAPKNVRFTGTQVEVQYHERWHNVSEQSFKQRFSVKGFLEAHDVKPPFIVNLIWLRQVTEEHLPQSPHNVFGKNTSWITLLQRLSQLNRPYWHSPSKTKRISAGGDMPRAIAVFSEIRKLQPTAIEEDKIKSVVRAVALKGPVPAYVQKLGTQLLMFQGRGGTGKTATLLKLAQVLYEYHKSRVLILTYNRVLTSDMRRLLALMDISDGVGRASIAVQTVHSFFYQLMKGFGILPEPCNDFLQRYDEYKMALEMLLSAHQESFNTLLQENNAAFSWNFICVDEAQDWPTDERNILFSVHDYRRLIIADGGDQLTRGYQKCNWIETLEPAQRQIVTLRKGLRLKAGVCKFANAFAEQVDLYDWNIEPFGVDTGRVIVLQGKYAENRNLHDEIVRWHMADKRSLIDMLFCVPPRLVRQDEKGHTYCVVANTFHDWGFQTWDATNSEVTNLYPTDTNKIRIVQYDSCRGLEGWSVVHLGFDDLYDYKVKSFIPNESEKDNPDFDHAKAAHEYAMRWLFIPLTRGMNTLVIQLSPTVSLDHPVLIALKGVKDRYPDLVEWRTV